LVSGDAVPPTAAPERIKVQPGQTLSGIAHTYHIPMQAIAETNHLLPPYRIGVGQTLVIPLAGQPTAPLASASLATISPPKPEEVTASKRPEAVPADHLTPPPPAGSPPTASTPGLSAGPATADAPRRDSKSAAAPTEPPVVPEPQTSPPPTASARAPDGTFLWPVRGHVLAGYGSGRDGTHNDGINISAPRGAAVEATDEGVVAYAGNELRGYGNLILVKHRNGWISAYAHCDLILVKRGDKVARGQTIARVGATGNVAEPQLHFELRRGNHAVDPREFLVPLPTAGTERGSPPG
jgi:murein DD-endopeptidase MepM/ murein hydrolase activator NlpD